MEELDFFTDIRVTEDLPGYFAAKRAECPVVREKYHGVYMITGMAEAIQVFTEHADAFSNAISVTGPIPPLPFTPEGDIRVQIAAHRHQMSWTDHLATQDGAEHAAQRAMLSKLLTYKRLKANEEYVEGLVEQLVEGLIDRGRCEVTEDFGHAVSTLVIADLLGVPEQDRQWLLDALGPDPTQLGGDTELKMGPDPIIHLHGRFHDYMEERLRVPQDDMLTDLAQATFKDGTDPGLAVKARLACFLFGAGQDTSAQLLGFAFRILGDHPEIQERLRSEPERIPDFIEEVLRFEPPVKVLSRLALRDVEVGGVTVPKGSIISIGTIGANRDPRHFDDPDTFDYHRRNVRDGLAFSKGAHGCIGAPLARMEARVAMEHFLGKTRQIRISEEHHGPPHARRYAYEPTYLLHGLQELHIEWDKA
ncbi:cytochrome P450 [Sphingobium sp. DEHP117]|uniref:cytochrome P450 n=1 Tax=Sphingobium sp. DEHP117 TaxID=2993436 RepID=UPI0027D54156|nr:cytochrome P450 [Sphingobium sp. DEHP117]MDQ4420393.1 cytochrome P450 [Sphingobium sp. DEHP117]